MNKYDKVISKITSNLRVTACQTVEKQISLIEQRHSLAMKLKAQQTKNQYELKTDDNDSDELADLNDSGRGLEGIKTGAVEVR